MKRSRAEMIYIWLFFPCIIGFYLIYKYPIWFVREDEVEQYFYWFGKSTGFWYSTIFTAIVTIICVRVLLKGKTPYGKNRHKTISSYQRNKFTSILISQTLFFYFVPYFLPLITKGTKFFGDSYAPINKNAYIYVYNGFTSLGGFVYIFVLIPLIVWFFGKRYCSWFCACGNLAETIGVTTWGNRWVTERTPRGKFASQFEVVQYIFLFLAIFFGMILFLDTWKIVTAGDVLQSWRAFQDLVVDLIFGAVIGVGAYPFCGTRIWCRYGCPLVGGMRIFGKFSKSKFQVEANANCKGLNLCTTQCPMGINVASYAHQDGTPIEGSFGLKESPCIGCGGCIDVCPVKAISFKNILEA